MWKLEKTTLKFDQLLVNESLFSLGNGYLGARSCFEEGYPDGYSSIRGTYINGFYDIVDVLYSEKAHGFPETSQKQPTLIDGQTIEIYLDGERVS
jgi:alpha,alpha-trehalose phosphorylase